MTKHNPFTCNRCIPLMKIGGLLLAHLIVYTMYFNGGL